jgi:CII-binding regulator of phage lambda lysogenization HflD
MSDNTVISSLITSGFSIGVYILYKLIKRFRINSNCNKDTLNISIKDLHNKLDESNEIIKNVISTINQVNNEEIRINIPPEQIITS